MSVSKLIINKILDYFKYKNAKKRKADCFIDSLDCELYGTTKTYKDTLTNQDNIFHNHLLFNKDLIEDAQQFITYTLENGDNIERMFVLYIIGEITQTEAAKKINMHPRTFSHKCRQWLKILKLKLGG